MRCPVDDAPLREVTRRGVKIDLCADCRGIWLDRGELEHLLEAAGAADEFGESGERAATDSRVPRPLLDERRVESRAEPRHEERRDYDDRRRRDDDDDDDRRGKKKKRSWLSEILEFGE